jgi:hypothetical protein
VQGSLLAEPEVVPLQDLYNFGGHLLIQKACSDWSSAFILEGGIKKLQEHLVYYITAWYHYVRRHQVLPPTGWAENY